MRVRIIFKLKNKGAFVPFHHQYIIAQFIKGLVVRGGEDKYMDYTMFNFSGLKGQTKVSRNGLHFYSARVTLVLACPDKEFVDHILKQIFESSQVELGNLILIPELVEQEKFPEFEEEIKYICISPLLLTKPSLNEETNKLFVSPEIDVFSDLLYEATITRMADSGKYTEEEMMKFSKFQLVPDRKYLQKIQETNKKFARIYSIFDQDMKFESRGYTLPFVLHASKEVQEFVFTCGLGAFTHKGFGMLDIANADPIDRVAEYKF